MRVVQSIIAKNDIELPIFELILQSIEIIQNRFVFVFWDSLLQSLFHVVFVLEFTDVCTDHFL